MIWKFDWIFDPPQLRAYTSTNAKIYCRLYKVHFSLEIENLSRNQLEKKAQQKKHTFLKPI